MLLRLVLTAFLNKLPRECAITAKIVRNMMTDELDDANAFDLDNEDTETTHQKSYDRNHYLLLEVLANEQKTIAEVASLIGKSYGYTSRLIAEGTRRGDIAVVGREDRKLIYTYSPQIVGVLTPLVLFNGESHRLFSIIRSFISTATNTMRANNTAEKRKAQACNPISRRARNIYLVLAEYMLWVSTTAVGEPLNQTREHAITTKKSIQTEISRLQSDINTIKRLLDMPELWDATIIRKWRVADEFDSETVKALAFRLAEVQEVMRDLESDSGMAGNNQTSKTTVQ